MKNTTALYICRAVFISHLCYPHIVDVFTNHVGDGAPDVPLPFAHTTLRYPHNVRHNCVRHHHYKFITQTLIPPQLAVGANIVRPFSFAHMVCTNSNLENPRKRDVEGAVPYIWRYSLSAAKSLSLFADFTSYKRTQKSGAEFPLRHRFAYIFTLFFSIKPTFPIMRINNSHCLQKRIYYDASHELHSTLFQV